MPNDSSGFQKLISTTLTAASQVRDITSFNTATSTINITGTWVGTIVVEGSNDDVNFFPVALLDRSTQKIVFSMTANGSYDANTNSFQTLQLRSSAWTSGTATLAVYGSDAASLIFTQSVLRGGTSGSIIGNASDSLVTSDGLSEGGVFGELTLTTGGTAYEAKVGGSILTNRKSLTITALDDMYWGYANTVTTALGTPLFKNQQIIFNIRSNSVFRVWVVAAASGKKARITESV